MSQKQTGRFCAHCQARTMATGSTPNHVLHLILSLLSLGLWSFVWLIIVLASLGNFRCTRCGSKV